MIPFQINTAPNVIADLNTRISNAILPDEVKNEKWQMGTSKAYLQELCDYWRTEFDWFAQETALNQFNHFKAGIEGFDLHFIYEKGKGKRRIPVLLIHGWPDSFYRFYKLIPLLTQAGSGGVSFDVIVPSLPGFGFTESHKDGVDSRKIASVLNSLMISELGYSEYFVHGGDWGTSIAEKLALYHTSNILGLHLTDLPFAHTLDQPDDGTDAELKFFKEIQEWQQKEGAYSMIQATKPQTLAYALTDSPVGLAAWIIEKFHRWSDHSGDIETAFSKDELLTNITLYWITSSINSANRLYYEEMQTIMAAKFNPLIKLNPFGKTGDKVKVPTAFAFFPRDISAPPKEFADRFFPIVKWTKMDAGGHFAALEVPESLAMDIREFMTSNV
ncbi:MAG: alpha/beta fold hydrolase [Mucilaginibacter polytrichastri]|nr:alpha/beta fold hydrolase [Mucilaginibacter polytrichastri]